MARKIGFGDGVRAFVGGAAFVVRTPSVWVLAVIPTVIAAMLFVGLGALALWPADELARRIAGEGSAALWILRVVFALIGLVLAFLVAASFAQPVSGFALDAIVRRQEIALGGRRWPAQPRIRSALRSLWVAVSALALSLPLLGVLGLVTFIAPPAGVVTIPLKFLVTGLAVAYDFLDYPFSIRGQGVPARLVFVRRHFGAVLGFGVAGALFLLIPGIGLFLLPVGVAGATRMVVLADDASLLRKDSGSCDDGSP